MKKYLLTALLLLTIILTLIACGSEEPTVDTTNNNTTNENVVGTENADDIDVPSTDKEENTSVIDEDTSENQYEGIDMESTLPGREWIQTTFPGVIDTPKIVIYNDETNRKTIVEEGEIVVYNESDTFAIYLPDGVTISRGSYLVNESKVYDYCIENKFNMERLKKEEQLWKNVDGGALYEITLDNNGTEEVFKCIISLGD